MTDGAERLRVLWVIKTLGYGGAEKLLELQEILAVALERQR